MYWDDISLFKGTIMKPDGTLTLTSHADSDFAGLFKVDPVERINPVHNLAWVTLSALVDACW
jgi:hypothetical protein